MYIEDRRKSESTTFLDGFDLGRLLCTHRESAYRPSEFDPSLTLLQERAGTYAALVDYMVAIHIREVDAEAARAVTYFNPAIDAMLFGFDPDENVPWDWF